MDRQVDELISKVSASIISATTTAIPSSTPSFDLIAAASSIGDPSWASDILGADEESPIPLDASEGGFFTGTFLPPPPRPLFLDDCATPDGVTTCDLCTWAWQQDSGGVHGYDATKEVPGEIGWVLTLVIVSLTSALIGAIVMIVVLHCRRLKSSEVSETERGFSMNQRSAQQRPPINTPDDKEISTITPANFPALPTHHLNHHHMNNNGGVWSWLSKKSTASPSQLNTPPSLPAENHYTHMEDAYNSVGEALYAELDRESSTADENERDSNSPAYQNSAYTDPDAPTSSAPSSAYYSDLSTTTVPDRAYEVVGLVTMPSWDHNNGSNSDRRPVPRLAAISEHSPSNFPSDYV